MKNLLIDLHFIITVILASPVLLFAQSAPRVSDDPELKKIILAIEANPENAKLHTNYNRAAGKQDEMQIRQYENWVQKFAKSPMIHYQLGRLYTKTDWQKARDHYQKTTALEPNFKDAWQGLLSYAVFTGSDSLKQLYSGQASKAMPKDPDLAFRHAQSYAEADIYRFDSLSLDIVRRFPESEEAAEALNLLSWYSKDPVLKNIYLEQARRLFFSHQTLKGSSAIRIYYMNLLLRQPEKALEVALDMIRLSKLDLLEWKHKAESAKKIHLVNQLVNDHKYEEAIGLLKSVNQHDKFANSRLGNDDGFRELQTELYALNGEVRRAFDTLATDYSSSPKRKRLTTLLKYGKLLGMDSSAVIQHIWNVREKSVVTADPVSLINLRTNERISLEDFRGKVILLTNWYPSCGPCRAEFPYFERVIKKFADNVMYIGVNGLPEETSLVLPFLASTGYSFMPLEKGSPKNDKVIGSLGNLTPYRGYPTNFLIDQRGKIVFRNFQAHNEEAAERLELMIVEMLKRAPRG